MSEGPRLFVVCFLDDEAEEEAGELVPVLVTASQDEAGAHMESDDPVFAVPMPEGVHRWVEAYVVANYEPEAEEEAPPGELGGGGGS